MISVGVNWQNFFVNHIMVHCQKSMTISFKIFLLFILTKPEDRFLNYK